MEQDGPRTRDGFDFNRDGKREWAGKKEGRMIARTTIELGQVISTTTYHRRTNLAPPTLHFMPLNAPTWFEWYSASDVRFTSPPPPHPLPLGKSKLTFPPSL
jgi:hypothetical protein